MRRMTLALFFKQHGLRNALKRSTSFPIASNSATSAVDYAKFYSRSHDAVIRVYNKENVIETRQASGASPQRTQDSVQL
jgi:hypothetical protein